jgi:Zn-finger nucleic acid-binding protein
MGRIVIEKVALDGCSACQALWFDAGELATLKGLQRSPVPRAQPLPPQESGSDEGSQAREEVKIEPGSPGSRRLLAAATSPA